MGMTVPLNENTAAIRKNIKIFKEEKDRNE